MRRFFVVVLWVPVFLFGLSWRTSILVNMPTGRFELVMGVDPLALEGYDDIDNAIPLLPPSGIQAFFSLNDPGNPYITMLSTDVRPDDGNMHTWVLVPYGILDPVTVEWNPLMIPRGDALFGICANEPSLWNDMRSVSDAAINPGQKLWIKHDPYASGENSAPYVLSTSPENGETGVSIYTPIIVNLADNETGINPNSVRMYVEGVDVTSQVSMTGGDGVLTLTYIPDVPFDGLQNVDVSIFAGDIGTVPLYVSHNFHFVTATAPTSVVWEVVLQISSGDEMAVPISFGVNESATDGFDPGGVDVPLPVPPFTALYGYFPINDPEFPYIYMLTRDIRSSENYSNVWEVRWGNATENVRISWNTLSVPTNCLLEIAVGTHGVEPDEEDWVDMRTVGDITCSVNQVAYIRSTRLIVDDEPPSLVYSIPASGSVGVSLETNLVFAIVDHISGVNVSSIRLIVDGVDVTEGISISNVVDTVFVLYDPPANFMPNYTVNWVLYVSDNALTPNSTTISGHFVTGVFAEILWSETLLVNVVPSTGLPYSANLVFGADESATEHFDYGIDLPAMPPFPGRPEIYFAITDPVWNRLSRDIRDNEADSVRWRATFMGFTGYGEANISWTGENLPNDGIFRWATSNIGEEPGVWTPMIGSGQFTTSTDIVFHIMFLRNPAFFCITGNVTLSDLGVPSVGASVVIEELDETLYTDALGHYQVCDLPVGVYTLHFAYPGYLPETHIINLTRDIRFDVSLEPACCISGNVTLSDDGPAIGAVISINELGISTTTFEDGYYQMCNIPAGMYTIVVNYPGYLPETTVVELAGNQTIDFVLGPIPRYGNIVVVVGLEGTTDFSGTYVTLYTLDTVEIYSETTDMSGSVIFWSVAYGEYLISADHSGYEPYLSFVTVDSPSETIYIELRFPRGRVWGFANTENPLDMAGTAVILDGTDTVFTDEVGSFEFPGVPYGVHSLSFRHNGYEPFDTTFTLSGPDIFIAANMRLHIVLGAPQNLTAINGMHNRVALKWLPPVYQNAELQGYMIVRTSFSGIDTIAILPSWVTCYIDRDVQVGFGNYYWYRVYSVYDRGNSNPSSVLGYAGDDPADPDVLIYDFDNGALVANDATADEATVLRTALESAGIVVEVTPQDASLDEYELLEYKVVIVVTGIFDGVNTVIPDASQRKLMSYVGGGGWIWWEGADIARDYVDGWGSLLGFALANDGRPRPQGNVTTLRGLPGVFFGQYSASYYYRTLADHRVDELTAVSPGVAFLFSQDDPAPNVSNVRGVVCAPTDSWSNYRSAITSVYYGGIQPTDELVRRRYIRGIYWYLTGEDIGNVVWDAAKLPRELYVSVSPNPFNSSATISFCLPEQASVSIEVSDILGKNITTICRDEFSAGTHQLTWDASDLSSGIYFVIVVTDIGVSSTPVLLVK